MDIEEKPQKCLICSGLNHSHETCTNRENVKCANCSGNHAACSKLCPAAKEALEKEKNGRKEKMTRIFGNASSHSNCYQNSKSKLNKPTNDPTMLIANFISALLYNPNPNFLEQLNALLIQNKPQC